ncbi:MAG TPA: exodeoxyribonuclease III [Candidatus Saccharimonadia bacterium]|nr:exodeoxyribonuclease III [Candidatus Saccharimonadia bacterium]
MQIVSWNVNGLRAVAKRGFLPWLLESGLDIVCLQEIKIDQAQMPIELTSMSGYHCYFNWASQKGYSGVAVYTKVKPQKVTYEVLLNERFNQEGRALLLEFEQFCLLNLYLPHGGRDKSKLDYKLEVYDQLAGRLNGSSGKPLILAGDFNVAHQEIDLARPRQNRTNIMFTADERERLGKVLASGYIDSYRWLHAELGGYSWWPYAAKARERNIGWRIDYILVANSLAGRIRAASIRAEVAGSDHCPVSLAIDLGQAG